MKMVVKIPDDIIKSLEQGSFGAKYNIYDLVGCLMNGTLLPEHHGRLIDEQQIIDRFKPVEKYRYWRIGLDGLFNVLSDAPTIIEGSESE